MICIIIPTLDRFTSLINTIDKLRRFSLNRKFVIAVVVDGNWKMMKRLNLHWQSGIGRRPEMLMFNDQRIGWGRSINKVMAETDYDYYMAASDDLEFLPGTLSIALEDMNKHFPDGDGVIGFNQANLKHFCPGAFVLVGRKWVDRFPERQMYFPGYKHFCVDSEHWHYAESEGKFFFSLGATVVHRRFQDECHRLAQSSLKRDRVIWWMKKGNPELYWGNNNDLEYWQSKINRIIGNGKLQEYYKKGRKFLGSGGVT